MADPARKEYASFDHFWPDYLEQHSQPLTRWLHFAGTTNMIGWIVAAFIQRRPALLLAGLVTSYAFAWTGHFLVERNRPATFTHPVQASLGDLRMYGQMWRGQLWRGRMRRA